MGWKKRNMIPNVLLNTETLAKKNSKPFTKTTAMKLTTRLNSPTRKMCAMTTLYANVSNIGKSRVTKRFGPTTPPPARPSPRPSASPSKSTRPSSSPIKSATNSPMTTARTCPTKNAELSPNKKVPYQESKVQYFRVCDNDNGKDPYRFNQNELTRMRDLGFISDPRSDDAEDIDIADTRKDNIDIRSGNTDVKEPSKSAITFG